MGRLFTVLLIPLFLTRSVSAESLKDYKNQKHRPLQKTQSGETVTKTCGEAYIETCQRSCADTACRMKCEADAGPYCKARASQVSKEEGALYLKMLLVFAGPLITLIDGPRNYATGGDDYDPYKFIWNFPSYNLDFGAGYLQGGAYGLTLSGQFRYDHFGLGANVAYLNEKGDSLGEYDLGPQFYLGSTYISAAIQPSLIGSSGSGIKPEYGFGVRTTTTVYAGQFYVLLSPLLGKINDEWLFHLRFGAGWRFTPNWAAHLVFEHRSVVDLATLAIASASLNGVFLNLSFRVN